MSLAKARDKIYDIIITGVRDSINEINHRGVFQLSALTKTIRVYSYDILGSRLYNIDNPDIVQIINDIRSKSIKSIKGDNIANCKIFSVVDTIVELFASGKATKSHLQISIPRFINYNHLDISTHPVLVPEIQVILDCKPLYITYKCDVCGRWNSIEVKANKPISLGFKPYITTCCVSHFHSLQGEELERYAIDNFNKYNKNRCNVYYTDRYTMKCRNRHITSVTNYLSSTNWIKPDHTCWICESHIEQEVYLFQLLKELKCNYFIKQLTTRNNKRGKYTRHLAKLMIYTRNDKGHLTGKIIFDVGNGEEQVKAKRNGLVYRYFDLIYLEDELYCRNFLHDYFEEIAIKNKLI